MDVKEAVAKAKEYFKEVFEGEGHGAPTLEEVWFDDNKNEWCITMGISHNVPVTMLDPLRLNRQIRYKTIRISDQDGKVISVLIRDTAAA